METSIYNNRIPWNKGKKNIYSKDTIMKMRVAKLNKVSSFKGRKHSLDSIAKIVQKRKNQNNAGSKKGCISPFKGRSHSKEVVDGMRERAKNQINRAGPKGKPWSEKRVNAQKLVARRIVVQASPVIRKSGVYHPAWDCIRKVIYKRDNWLCFCCGVHCQMKSKLKIQCHHIDYDKTNNDPSNLITLCASCHAKTNFDRLDWIMFFKSNKISTK